MKQFAVAVLLIAAMITVGCGSNSSANPANINGSWNAVLSQTNNSTFFTFGTSLLVQGDGSLSITNLTITAPSPCFQTAETESGSFTLSGNFNGNVTGKFSLNLTSANPAGNTLTLTGAANNGTIGGTWTLSGIGCTGNGTFTMTKILAPR